MKPFVAVPVCILSGSFSARGWAYRVLASWVLLLALSVGLGSFGLISPTASAHDGDLFGHDDPFRPNPARKHSVKEAPSVDEIIDRAPPSVPQIWADDDDNRKANESTRETLNGNLTSSGLVFQDTPLEEVLEFLRDEYHLNILLDLQALDDLGLGPDEPISVNLKNIKLEAALRFMLKPLELTTTIQDGILVVTSEDEALVHLEVAVYPIHDLITVADGNSNELIRIIVSTISSDTWAENGGGESEINFLSQRGTLVISQTTQVHQQILHLLNALRQCKICKGCKAQKIAYGGMGGGAGCGGDDEEESEARSREGGGFDGGGGGQF